MRLLNLLAICLMVSFLGCEATPKQPDPEWIKDFDNADTVVLRRKNAAPVTITDSATVNRLQSIYTDSKWVPYWHTLPGHLRERTIEIYNGDTKLRTFPYTGTLWESKSYTENRTAELSDADQQWIDSLFESN